MRGTPSLARRLALLTSLVFAVVWVLATLTMAFVLRGEQEEMLDLTLRETAELFQPVLADRWASGDATPLGSTGRNADEALVYLLLDADGAVLLRSAGAEGADLPPGPPRRGHARTATHTFYTTAPDTAGHSARFGDPNAERREAYLTSLAAFLLPLLLLLIPAYLGVVWLTRAALRPLGAVRAEIGRRGEGRLDPIDGAGQPEELRAITATLNALMERLDRAIEGERSFATNAAHELRTPVAVALAQVQRLRAEGGAAARVERIEGALLRMSRLVNRLLQLARADSGLGAAAETRDIAALLDHVLDDSRRDGSRAPRLNATRPPGPVPARIDADAFAIVAGNLIDNAFQHALDGATVTVELFADCALIVSNPAAAMTDAEVAGLTRRFDRGCTGAHKGGAGFGLGLHIADTIARQAGGTLDLASVEAAFVATFRPLAG